MNKATGRTRGHTNARSVGDMRKEEMQGVVAEEDHKQEMDWRQRSRQL